MFLEKYLIQKKKGKLCTCLSMLDRSLSICLSTQLFPHASILVVVVSWFGGLFPSDRSWADVHFQIFDVLAELNI